MRQLFDVTTLRRQWGSAVSQRRQHLGLSQAQLGKACSVSQQTISKIERGRMLPLDHLKVRIASSLGTTPQALFRWPPGDGC